MASSMRIAVEGCGHGTLDAIYSTVQKSCEVKGWDGLDLLVICGDFQAVRNRQDLNVTAMPAKYREMGDFHQYYYGTKTAPYLTVFIGGNHEASNYLFELYYGGWVAPNIYYLGVANVLRLGSLKIAALSGIWKGLDYRRHHHERLPYNDEEMRSIYHQREVDVRKLLAYRSQVDIGLSHDWPHEIWQHGDYKHLFARKSFFRDDAHKGQLGSKAATQILDRLRPPHWFSAHLHFKYTAIKDHDDEQNGTSSRDNQAIEANRLMQPKQVLQRGVAPKVQDVHTTNGHMSMAMSSDIHHEAVNSWQEFGKTIEARDALANKLELEALQEEERVNGKKALPVYNYEETYRPVRINFAGGAQSRQIQPSDPVPQIPQYDGTLLSTPSKRRRNSSPSDETQAAIPPRRRDQTDGASANDSTVTNPDAIVIDMSDSDDDNSMRLMLSKAQFNDKGVPATAPDPQPIAPSNIDDSTTTNIEHNHDSQKTNHLATDTARISASPLESGDAKDDPHTVRELKPGAISDQRYDEISEEMRAQLAELSSTFADEKVDKLPDLPFPVNITNKTTHFLALSKPESGHDRDFIQLLEIETVDSEAATTNHERPLELQYDPEWLAILRTFADELKIGGSKGEKGPVHRGDTFYRDRIIEEEKWVKENVTDMGLLTVPDNFKVTVQTTENHADQQIEETVMPREETNPQTAQFCRLIGIENKFDFSEEDRDARMAAGPAESSFVHRGRGGGSRGSGRRGGHGRGRGERGRGGRSRGRW